MGFAAETRELIANAMKKMKKKNLDMIVANDVSRTDAGFATDTNQVKIIYADGKIEDSPLLTKDEVAHLILDRAIGMKKFTVSPEPVLNISAFPRRSMGTRKNRMPKLEIRNWVTHQNYCVCTNFQFPVSNLLWERGAMDYPNEIKEIFSHMKGRLKDHEDMGFDPPSLPQDLVDSLDKPAVSVPEKADALSRSVPLDKTATHENVYGNSLPSRIFEPTWATAVDAVFIKEEQTWYSGREILTPGLSS